MEGRPGEVEHQCLCGFDRPTAMIGSDRFSFGPEAQRQQKRGRQRHGHQKATETNNCYGREKRYEITRTDNNSSEGKRVMVEASVKMQFRLGFSKILAMNSLFNKAVIFFFI